MQLIPPMLGDEHVARGVDGKAFAIAYPSGEALSRRKCLVRFVGVVTPYAAARLEFGTWIGPGYFRLAVFRLAGVGRGGNVNIHRSVFADDEWMHRMIATERQSGN